MIINHDTLASESTTNPADSSCALCTQKGGELVWTDEVIRVVAVDDPLLPGYTRVIWNSHVREMSDLSPASQQAVMQAVFCVEQTQRTHLRPDKINLASLGNMTPHLHWHIIPRWKDDPWFPDSIWEPQTDDCEVAQAWETRARMIAAEVPDYLDALKAALEEQRIS